MIRRADVPQSMRARGLARFVLTIIVGAALGGALARHEHAIPPDIRERNQVTLRMNPELIEFHREATR